MRYAWYDMLEYISFIPRNGIQGKLILRNFFPLLYRQTYITTLPSNDLIYDFLLLHAASSQIDTSCFYAFVSHEVGKQGDVVELLQEILGIAMAERVGVNHFFVQAILHRIVLQLL